VAEAELTPTQACYPPAVEFSYRISEADYRRAYDLYRKKASLICRIPSKLILVVVVVLALVPTYSIIQRHTQQAQSASTETTIRETNEARPPDAGAALTSNQLASLLENVGPFLLLVAVWIFVVFFWLPGLVGKTYRKNPLMQGEYTLSLTPDCLVVANTAGLDSRLAWPIFSKWIIKENIVILIYKSGSYLIVNLAGLDPAEQIQFRSILAESIPGK
jgi:hypothetical protein